MYADIHCHLDAFDDVDAVVYRARKAGVEFILTNGLNAETNAKSLLLQERFPEVKAALGLYPNDAVALSEDEQEAVYEQIRAARPVAIGEIGLDYYHDDTKKEEMKKVFSELLALAEELKIPVLVHSRKAEADVLDILSSHSVVCDLHCFGGSLKLARRAIDAGHYFSIPTSVTRATHFQRLSQEVSEDKLLTETDAPWQSPDEHRNEPKNISRGVEAIATARKQDLDELRSQLLTNAYRFIPSARR
jgi:TatD DNase family protein